jgi:Na+/H+-dicarboxylate symporter/ABC-type amino acid transport substrate-binding protein
VKFTLGYQILVAVILGIFAGLFFGPLCSVLTPVAMAFTMLVQMVVLPYILFSLIHGLGSISMKMGGHLLRCGLPYLLLIWALVYIALYGVQLLIPTPLAAYAMIPYQDSSEGISEQVLRFLVPENPIYDLANNVVPAIAVFGLIVGLALMQLPKKEILCNVLERVNGLIEKILVWLAIISPIGAFAHIAIAFGTVRFEDLYKLEFYVFCYIGLSLFVTFWVLPILLSCLTPMTYRETLSAFRAVCLVPFVTALSSLSVPFLNDFLLKLSKKNEVHAGFHENAQTVLPLAYSFGQIGNCVILFFIGFLSFYYRHPLEEAQKVLLAFLSIPLSIGSSSNSVNSISFLIDQFKFPHDGINLFMETSSITANFQVLMSIASVLTIILITIYGYYGLIQVKWKELTIKMGSTIVFFFIAIISLKSLVTISDRFQNLYPELTMSEVITDPVESKILQPGETGTPRDATRSSLEQILETGVLKVGYNTFDIPYCYWNDKHELSGFDMAYAYQLARDLDCKLEFVPLSFDTMGQQLDSGLYDIGMAAIVMNENRLKSMSFTHHYSTQNIVLVVTQKRKQEFMHLDKIIADKHLRIGVIGAYTDFIKRHFPNATIYQTDDIDTDMMKRGEIDAWIWGADPATVWCVSNPDFITVDYGGLIGKAYFAYAVPDNAFKLTSYLNNVLILKELSGFQDMMYNYWVKGEPNRPRPIRWSILHNILKVNK